MTKPIFDNDFKQRVVNYVLEHPDESKLSVAKRFGISDSTVHKWLKDAGTNNQEIHSRGSGNFSSNETKELVRLKKIKNIYEKSYRIYDPPKITAFLQQNIETESQKYVYMIMKENSLKTRYIKQYTIITTGQNFSAKLKNLFNRHFNPLKPDTAWCSDITYI